MNTVLADSISWIADQLEQRFKAGESLNTAAFAVLQQVMQEHGAVVFGGDGYAAEWHRIAVEERGLENLPTSADALPVLRRPEIRELFERHGVLNAVELDSRFAVYAEQYALAVEVECKLALQMARTLIYPAAMRYLNELAAALQAQQAMGLAPSLSQRDRIGALLQELTSACEALEQALDSGEHHDDPLNHIRTCADTLMPLLDQLRAAVDGLEAQLDDGLWPLPTYQELLFVR
jgi:glutamine synthetase